MACAALCAAVILVTAAVLSLTALPGGSAGRSQAGRTPAASAGASPSCATSPGGDLACGEPVISGAGWTRPVPGEVINNFRTARLPNHQGIDLDAARRTVIRAASAGTVVTELCNIDGRFYPVDHTPSPCDSDGSPSTGGCGWYMEIRHSGDIVSRYCHMVTAPTVAVGQIVVTGQPIGLAGTSGNSSAVHLHFEIHRGYPAGPQNAVDPIPFLADKGVILAPAPAETTVPG